MRNLFLFIYRFQAFFLFLILEIICLVLIIQNNSYPRAAFLNVSDEISGRTYSWYNGLTEYLRLGTENKNLASQNALLLQRLASAHYSDSTKTITVKDSSGHQLYTFISCKVIQNTTNQKNNYLMLDKGKLQGIEPRMAVIGPNGVVGIVKATSDHFSECYSLLHSQVTVSARVGRTGSRGLLKWDGNDAGVINLEEVPRQQDVHEGDTIFTSGASRLFPENIVVGIVQSFTLKQPGNFYSIKARPATDFRKVDYVYVVNNLMRGEMDSIIVKEENAE